MACIGHGCSPVGATARSPGCQPRVGRRHSRSPGCQPRVGGHRRSHLLGNALAIAPSPIPPRGRPGPRTGERGPEPPPSRGMHGRATTWSPAATIHPTESPAHPAGARVLEEGADPPPAPLRFSRSWFLRVASRAWVTSKRRTIHPRARRAGRQGHRYPRSRGAGGRRSPPWRRRCRLRRRATARPFST